MKNSLMSLIYFPQCLFFSKIIHLQKGYSISNRPKFQRLGLDSDSDETFPDERYIQDKVTLKISVQTDNLFKNYDTLKCAW